MLKKAAQQAAADESTGGVASGLPEDAFAVRPQLEVVFSILLCRDVSRSIVRRSRLVG